MDMHRDRDIRKQANPGPGESLFPEKQVFVLQKSEPEEPVPQEQVFDMHHIRSTILKQEAVFRDQVLKSLLGCTVNVNVHVLMLCWLSMGRPDYYLQSTFDLGCAC